MTNDPLLIAMLGHASDESSHGRNDVASVLKQGVDKIEKLEKQIRQYKKLLKDVSSAWRIFTTEMLQACDDWIKVINENEVKDETPKPLDIHANCQLLLKQLRDENLRLLHDAHTGEICRNILIEHGCTSNESVVHVPTLINDFFNAKKTEIEQLKLKLKQLQLEHESYRGAGVNLIYLSRLINDPDFKRETCREDLDIEAAEIIKRKMQQCREWL